MAAEPFADEALLRHRVRSHARVAKLGDVYVPVVRGEGREGLFCVDCPKARERFVLAFQGEDDAHLMAFLINSEAGVFASAGDQATVEHVPALAVWEYVQATVRDAREHNVPGFGGPVSLSVIRAGDLHAALDDEWMAARSGRRVRGRGDNVASLAMAGVVRGCTDELAVNYRMDAVLDDGSCMYTQ